MHRCVRLTFLPTSSSRKKKPAPRSSSETLSPSEMINLPIPARTMFLIASVATPRSRIMRMVALRILHHSRSTIAIDIRSTNMVCAPDASRGRPNGMKLTSAELRGPTAGSACRIPLLHLWREAVSLRLRAGPQRRAAFRTGLWTFAVGFAPSVIWRGTFFPAGSTAAIARGRLFRKGAVLEFCGCSMEDEEQET